MLVRELLFLSQLTTTSIYSKNSSESKKMRFCKRFSGNKLVLSISLFLRPQINFSLYASAQSVFESFNCTVRLHENAKTMDLDSIP